MLVRSDSSVQAWWVYMGGYTGVWRPPLHSTEASSSTGERVRALRTTVGRGCCGQQLELPRHKLATTTLRTTIQIHQKPSRQMWAFFLYSCFHQKAIAIISQTCSAMGFCQNIVFSQFLNIKNRKRHISKLGKEWRILTLWPSLKLWETVGDSLDCSKYTKVQRCGNPNNTYSNNNSFLGISALTLSIA